MNEYANPDALVSTEWLAEHLEAPDVRVVDGSWHMPQLGREARGEFESGHIPGALNLPFLDLYDPTTKTIKPAAALTALYAAAGVREGAPVTTSCGSGITACNLALGLHLIGRDEVAVYDGSWTEWGGRDDTPIER